jgi:hypothetical protein
MSAPGIPQDGWWTDEEWADCLQESIKTFRRKARQYGIPMRRWGNVWLIHARDFYEALPTADDESVCEETT